MGEEPVPEFDTSPLLPYPSAEKRSDWYQKLISLNYAFTEVAQDTIWDDALASKSIHKNYSELLPLNGYVLMSFINDHLLNSL